MKLNKLTLVFGIVALILAFSALGGIWSRSSAQITIPTEPTPTPRPGVGRPGEPGVEPNYCVYGVLKPGQDLDLYLPVKQNMPKVVWAGIDTPGSASCEQAVERLCMIPVSQLPHRDQLYYYRMAMEARQFIKGRIDHTPACGSREVYFELTRYERFMLDNYPDQVGIFHYDPETKAWVKVESSLDEEVGDYGRLVVNSDVWGLYAMGWPAIDED